MTGTFEDTINSNAYASSSEFTHSRKRAFDLDDEENVAPKRSVPFDDSHDRKPFTALQPNAQSTPHNFNYYQSEVPTMPTNPPAIYENYSFGNQWPNPMYSQYQPPHSTPLSTQPFIKNLLPTSSFPMDSFPFQAIQSFAQNNAFNNAFNNNLFSAPPFKPIPTQPPVVPKDEVFTRVPGRLALLNANTKIDVSVAEVTRRVRTPENLNISLLGAVLRRAKNKGSNDKLKEELVAKGIEMAKGRRRSLALSTFTALCEEEAFKLAEDFQNAIKDHLDANAFPSEVGKAAVDKSSPVSVEILESFNNFKHHTTEDEMADAIADLMVLLFRCAAEVLERDRSLLDMEIITPEKFGVRKPLSPDFQHQLKTFNLVTHNFGVKAVQAVFSSLSKTDEPSNSSGECEDSDGTE
ncbi:hypothetical protein M3Y94_00499200 [Aphelenchoides besseyi]|nr:hypothetical protein M3Y94_00499200 [Aphelenchoides besseyi]KAI6217290.1 Transcription factor AP-2 [Aphelenchoides besseyi]